MQTDTAIRKYFAAPEGAPVIRDMAEIQKLVQPGDVGCSVGSKAFAGCMRLVYNAPYTHTFTVCVPDDRIAEALPAGYVQGPLQRYSDSHFAILRWEGVTHEQQLAMGNLAREKATKTRDDKAKTGYDWGELGWLVAVGFVVAYSKVMFWRPKAAYRARALAALMSKRNLLDSKGRVICSGEAEDISETQGFTVGVVDGMVAPSHFATCGRLVWVAVHPAPGN